MLLKNIKFEEGDIMKKSLTILISILIILAIIGFGSYYALTPNKPIDTSLKGKVITRDEILKGSFIKSGNVYTNPLRVAGTIAIDEEEFKDIVYTIMTNKDITEFENIYIEIVEDKIKFISTYKIMGIQTQLEVNAMPSIENGNLKFALTNAKVGKINISNKILSKTLYSFRKKIPFEIKDNNIIIEEQYMSPMTLENIRIENDSIIIDLQIKINNLIDFMTKYDFKINNL